MKDQLSARVSVETGECEHGRRDVFLHALVLMSVSADGSYIIGDFFLKESSIFVCIKCSFYLIFKRVVDGATLLGCRRLQEHV